MERIVKGINRGIYFKKKSFVDSVNGITIFQKNFCILKIWMNGVTNQNPKDIIQIEDCHIMVVFKNIKRILNKNNFI